MKLFLLLSPFVLSIYLLAIYLSFGMTKSISATYKVLPEHSKSYFSLMWLLYVAPIVLITCNPWFIGSSLMIALVASNPNYWDKSGIQDNLHSIGALGTVTLGLAGLIHINKQVGIPVAIVYFAIVACIQFNYFFFAKVKNDTYWQEVLAAFPIPIILYFIL